MVDNPDGPTIPKNQFPDCNRKKDNCDNHDGYENNRYNDQEPVVEERISAKEEAERWKNRRRLAYISMCATFVATILLYFIVPETRLDALSNVTEWFYIIMGTVITSYVGSATWHDVMSLKQRVIGR